MCASSPCLGPARPLHLHMRSRSPAKNARFAAEIVTKQTEFQCWSVFSATDELLARGDFALHFRRHDVHHMRAVEFRPHRAEPMPHISAQHERIGSRHAADAL